MARKRIASRDLESQGIAINETPCIYPKWLEVAYERHRRKLKVAEEYIYHRAPDRIARLNCGDDGRRNLALGMEESITARKLEQEAV